MGLNKSDLIAKLNEIVRTCILCDFHKNGRALPFFGTKAKYLMIGEAPHTVEIEQGTPFVGDSGEFMWSVIYDNIGLRRDDFIIWNSVMCKPTVTGKQTVGKPTKDTISKCFVKRTNVIALMHDYFDVRNILCLGNYARYVFEEKMSGIDKRSGDTVDLLWSGKSFKMTYCIHPASCLYNSNNKDKFQSSIRAFGEAILIGE